MNDNECDNESDNGSEVSLMINFLRIKTFFIIWNLIVYYHILVIHY